MSKEDAAAVYLDSILGFRAEYGAFKEASEILMEETNAFGKRGICLATRRPAGRNMIFDYII